MPYVKDFGGRSNAQSRTEYGQVAELAYAPGLGPGGSNPLWVQIPPCPPTQNPGGCRGFVFLEAGSLSRPASYVVRWEAGYGYGS